MTATLQPMNLGEILDRTIEIYRERFLQFAGLAALPALVIIGVQLSGVHWFHLDKLVSARNPNSQEWRLLVWLLLEHVAAFLGMLIMPAMVSLTSNRIFGERGTLRGSLRFALGRWRRYLWIAILKLAAEMLVPELATLALLAAEWLIDVAMTNGAFSRALGSMWLFGLPVLAGFALFLWVGAALALSIPVAAFEAHGGTRALRRSWRLSRGRRLHVLLIWAVLFACFCISNIVLQFLLGQLLFHLSGALHIENLGPKLYQAATFPLYLGVASLLGPIYPILITLIYYDQRIRREGYDIDMLMEATGLGALEAPTRTASSAVAE